MYWKDIGECSIIKIFQLGKRDLACDVVILLSIDVCEVFYIVEIILSKNDCPEEGSLGWNSFYFVEMRIKEEL